jgi:hypothetical protein
MRSCVRVQRAPCLAPRRPVGESPPPCQFPFPIRVSSRSRELCHPVYDVVLDVLEVGWVVSTRPRGRALRGLRMDLGDLLHEDLLLAPPVEEADVAKASVVVEQRAPECAALPQFARRRRRRRRHVRRGAGASLAAATKITRCTAAPARRTAAPASTTSLSSTAWLSLELPCLSSARVCPCSAGTAHAGTRSPCRSPERRRRTAWERQPPRGAPASPAASPLLIPPQRASALSAQRTVEGSHIKLGHADVQAGLGGGPGRYHPLESDKSRV